MRMLAEGLSAQKDSLLILLTQPTKNGGHFHHSKGNQVPLIMKVPKGEVFLLRPSEIKDSLLESLLRITLMSQVFTEGAWSLLFAMSQSSKV